LKDKNYVRAENGSDWRGTVHITVPSISFLLNFFGS
jgi:hypothetical protein